MYARLEKLGLGHKKDDPEKGAKGSQDAPSGVLKSGWGKLRGAVSSGAAAALATEKTALLKVVGTFTDDTTVLTYDPMSFTNYDGVFAYQGTIFAQKAMWAITASNIIIIFAIAVAMYFLVGQPRELSTDTISKVIKAVSILIGFLIGLFLSACVNRWWQTIKSLEKLFGCCKKLVMLSNNLGIYKEAKELLCRRVILSIRMLEKEIEGLTAEEWNAVFEDFLQKQIITEAEQDLMLTVPADQRSFFTWSLVSAVLKKVQPSVDPMSFDRISAHVLDGLGANSALKTLMAFQFPFLYVHMLAFMVHLCNLLIAIGTGFAVGRLLCLSRVGSPLDTAGISNELLFFLLQTFFYQAALFIGASLSFPIAAEKQAHLHMYSLPFKGMVEKLEKQLHMMIVIADRKDLDVGNLPHSGRGPPSAPLN